jgi:hypothetical protein
LIFTISKLIFKSQPFLSRLFLITNLPPQVNPDFHPLVPSQNSTAPSVFHFSQTMSNVAAAPKVRFAPDEDERLLEAVRIHGTTNWPHIATCVAGRNARQCRERWNNYVNPQLVKEGWTREEDALLQQKYNELGPRWAVIARLFEGRARNSVKNRLWAIQRKRGYRDVESDSERRRRKQPEKRTEKEEEEGGDIPMKGIIGLLNSQAFESPRRIGFQGLTVRRFVLDRERH